MHSEQGQKERSRAFSDLYIFSSHSTVDLYILLHFNTLDSIASVTTLISVTLSLISALLTLWGLSNASSLLFIMQGQARVTCLRALNFE